MKGAADLILTLCTQQVSILLNVFAQSLLLPLNDHSSGPRHKSTWGLSCDAPEAHVTSASSAASVSYHLAGNLQMFALSKVHLIIAVIRLA